MKVYESTGKILMNKIALIAVSLPLQTATNKYAIKKVYQPNAITNNVIVIHFVDSVGTALSNPLNNHEWFTIDLSSLNKINEKNIIEVALFHDNNISDSMILNNVDTIITNARQGTCSTLTFPSQTPKICGMGTIKP